MALSIIAIIFTSASVLDLDYIFKKNTGHLQRDLSSRVLTVVAEQTINPQSAVLKVELPTSCSGEEIEIGAGGYVLSSSEIICKDSSFRFQNLVRFMKKNSRKTQGFILMEVLIGLTILGITLLLFWQSYNNQIKSAKSSRILMPLID